jgi:RNA polymerase sigma factor (sigma-70 family)
MLTRPGEHVPRDARASPTDAETIRSSLREPERFAAIFDTYYADIHRYVERRLGPDAADDVAAETFLVAFRERERYDLGRPHARPWLHGIATNLIGRHRRQEVARYRALARAGSPAVVRDAAADSGADRLEDRVAERLAAGEVRPQLLAALGGLSVGDRDVVLLLALAQLTHDEVASALDIPLGTVRSRLHRARRKLRRALPHDIIETPELRHG